MNRRQLFASIGATAIAAAMPKPEVLGVAQAITDKPRRATMVVKTAKDYYQIDWPQRKRNYEYGDMFAEMKARYPQS